MPGSASDTGLPDKSSSDTNDQQGRLGGGSPPRQGSQAPEEPLSVLLIEDTEVVARRFEECLAEGPVEATLRYAESLEAGLQALREDPPDMLVVDLDLSESGSPEAVKALAWAAPEVPIVALTESGELGATLEAQRAGATEHLQKGELSPALVGQTLRWAGQRDRLHAKLRQRDAWIRSITEGLSVGIFRAGPTGRIEYANEALAEMLGLESESELVGRDLTTFYTDPTQSGQMLVEEGVSDAEVELRTDDGSAVVGLLSARAAYDARGRPVYYDGAISDITARRERKRTLRMLSEAVGQAKEAVLITEAEPLDKPGPRVVYVNEAFEEMTGWAEEEILGKTPRVLQGPETDREVLDSMQEALETGEEWEGETINYRKDGQPYRVQWDIAPVSGEDGDVEYWVSVQRDVTEVRRREEKLRLQARALDQVGDKVFITDRAGRIQYVNEAFEEITGYGEEEALGKTPRLVQSGEQSETFYEELWETVQSGDTFRSALTKRRKDGTLYFEEEVLAPVTVEEREITHFVSTGRDVTEKRRQEEEIRRQKSLLEQAQRLAGAWEVDLQTGEVSASQKVYEIHEVEPGTDLFLEETFEFFPPEVRPKIREAFEQCTEQGEPYDLELPLITAKGNRRWIRTVGAPTETKGGEVTKVAGAFQDITDRKESERELERMAEAMEAASDGMALLNEDGVYTYMNQAHAEMYGYDSPEAFIGNTWRMCYSEPEVERFETDIMPIVWKQESWRGEVPGTRKDGTRFPQTVTLTLLDDGGIICVAHDITERKKEERRRAQIVERVTDAIVEVDSDWRFTLVNEQAERLYEMSEEDLLGEDLWGVFSGALGTRFEEEYRGVMETREPTRFEEHYPGLDGWFDIQVYPNEDGGLAFYFEEITERKERERVLSEKERRYRAVFEDPNILVGLVSTDGRTLDINQTALCYIEEPLEEVQGMPFWETPWFEGDETVQEQIRAWLRQAAEGEYVEFEADLSKAVGEPLLVSGAIRPVTNEAGEVTSLLITDRDVTEQKETEKELRETTRFYEEVLEQIPIDLAVFSPEGKFEYINPRGLADPERREWLLGRTNEEYCRKRGFAPRVGRRRDEAIRKAAEDKTQIEFEETLDTEEGSRHYLRVHGPLTNTKGEVTHVAGFGLEITEQKEHRKRLERYREYTDHLLNASEDLFFVVDTSGGLERWNKQVASVTGYSEEELSDMSVVEFFPEADQARARGALEEVFATGRSKLETRLLTKEGSTIPYEFTGNRAEHPDGDLRLVGIGRDVTERKQREEKLQEQDRRLEQIRKNITDVVWMSTPDKGEIEFISEAYEEVWGHPTATLNEEPAGFIEAVHPEDRERVRSAMEVQKKAPEEYEETYRVVQPSGEVRWVRDRASGVYEENGRLERIIGVATDITEKKRHELELETVNTRLQLALESTNAGTFDWDIRANELIWDETSERLFGYEPGGFPESYEGWAERIHPDDLEEAERAIERAFETGETYDVEYRVRPPGRKERSGGEERWVQARGDTRYDEEGSPARMVGIHTDVTERKRREEALQDRREKAEALYKGTRRLLAAESPEAAARHVHEVIEEVFDYDLSNTAHVEEGLIESVDVATSDPVDVPPPEPRPLGGQSMAARALREGGTALVEDTRALDNEVDYGDLRSVAAVPIGTRGVIVLGQSEKGPFDPFDLRLIEVLAGYGGAVLGRLENERELIEAKEEAEEAVRLKTALLANMSHEIRTPLTSIIGFAELLEGQTEGEATAFAERIRGGGERLMKTLDSVLELSRLEAGIEDLSREEVSLRDVVQETIEILRPSAETKHLALETDFPEGPTRGYWNEAALNRILENLLENAIKFTPEGGRVEVRADVEDGEAVLEVDDTGIGIAREAQPEIFTAFKQESEGLSREYEGTGLGLSIVKRLAHGLGGSVDVASKKGQGSRFTVRLPAGKNKEGPRK